ncbi:MAG: ferritin family protein [Paracoccaceae bacterium]
MFDGMAEEEDRHRQRLIALHRIRFGDVIPLIRREHVAGWLCSPPCLADGGDDAGTDPGEAEAMERQAQSFYEIAAGRTQDAETRKLLGDLAAAEAAHEHREPHEDTHLDEDARATEDATAKRQFLLTWVQPGLAGLMDGSVSTLAPIFATAFATQNTDLPCGAGGFGRGRDFDGLLRSGIG